MNNHWPDAPAPTEALFSSRPVSAPVYALPSTPAAGYAVGMDAGTRWEKSLGAWVWIFLLAISLSLLTFGCDRGETVETKYELKSGDTLIIVCKLGPRHMMAGGRDCESSKALICWKQSGKTEVISKQFRNFNPNPAHLAFFTNKDFLVLDMGGEIWWRNQAQTGRWNSFIPTNSPAIWAFLKNHMKTHFPDSFYKITKADDGRETLVIWSHPAEIWLLEWSWSTGCNRIQVDFERHRLVAFCLENDRFPKLVFVEDGQFGRWKFDEHASEVENQSAESVP